MINEMNKSGKIHRIALIGLVVIAACLSCANPAIASGTAAGTNITNRATVDFTAGGSNFTVLSNVNVVRVTELLSHTVTWLDAAPGVTVTPGQAGRITTFRLTNTGNGNDTYLLSASSAGIGGDQFDPAFTGIYLDTNSNGTYDAATDALYAPGVNDPVLARDASIVLFVMNTIPGSGLADGATGITELTIASGTGSGAPGTVFAGAGDGGVDAVLGTPGGVRTITGTYVVSSAAVSMLKGVTVIDQYGGNLPIPGATLHYTISVTITGSDSANGLVIADPLPANTVYIPNSLRLNGSGLTDPADADAGDVNVTAPNTVTVNLGNIAAGSPAQTIEFDVKIN